MQPQEFSKRQRTNPIKDTKQFYVWYYVHSPDDPKPEPTEILVFELVIPAQRPSQARRTAQYILPAIKKLLELTGGLMFDLKPMDEHVESMQTQFKQILSLQKQSLKPNKKDTQSNDDTDSISDASHGSPDSPGSTD